jgi:4-oxalocrotonate tautomerase
MPFVEITLAEGRPPEKLRALITAVTDAVCESIAAPKANVRVVIREVPKTHWAAGDVTLAERAAQSSASLSSAAPPSSSRASGTSPSGTPIPEGTPS